ncbi:DUF535 family protein [Thalassolituus sp. LLYu03]|uniref:DUF535 family protein n=1 Tax=Thalassolituus sp. LLYu03 TaxID=3421656 RepID=UPI003D2AF0CB
MYISTIRMFWTSQERRTHKAKTLIWAFRHRHWIREFRLSLERLGLGYLPALHPYLLFMCRLDAFVLKAVSPAFIQERLVSHYSTLQQRLGRRAVEDIHARGLTLADVTVAGYPMRVSLCYVHRMRYEGQMTVRIDLDGQEFYSAHVHLHNNTLWIGGLQGVSGNLELSRAFTKATDGLRPQNLMYLVLTAVAQRLGLSGIQGVSSEFHYYQREEKTRDKIQFELSNFWQELGGEPSSEGAWFRLPVAYPRKAAADIPSKKRAQYLRRYEHMDAILTAIGMPDAPATQPLSGNNNLNRFTPPALTPEPATAEFKRVIG